MAGDTVIRARRFRVLLAVVTLTVVAAAALPSLIQSKMRPLRVVKAWALGSELLADAGVVFQTNASNCGHVALMMVLRRLALPVPANLIDRAAVAPWGLSASELAGEGRAAGAAANVLEVDDACLERALDVVPIPAIALLGTHFVVVDQRPSSGSVEIIDPGIGRLRMPLAVVRREWRRVLITFGELPADIRPALCG